MSLSKALVVNNTNGLGNTTSLEENILGVINNGDKRLFNFKLDSNATKSKLLKGAKRNPLEMTVRKACINLDYIPHLRNSLTAPLMDEV